MKFIVIALFIFISQASYASYHFVCFRKLSDKVFEKKASLLLLPVKADLTSDASLFRTTSNKSVVDFKYSKDLSLMNKSKYIILLGPEGMSLKIDSSGTIRVMAVEKNIHNILILSAEYRCEMESSV
jgi:hypothetical protein